MIDIVDIYKKNPKILDLLLFDNSSKKNIIWASSMYSYLGKGYRKNDEITSVIILNNPSLIKSRIKKSLIEKNNRTKDNAEVFTPSWICNIQNNLIDNEWFGKKNNFNIECKNNTWKTNHTKINFNNNSWKKYVLLNRMEITCGEAPYLVSRYDTVTGKEIKIDKRIGLLDRKIRIVNENASDEEWQEWVEKAYQHIYGYEYQGDNVFLARQNLLCSYLEYFHHKFKKLPKIEFIKNIAEIISWNIWQMDGLKGVVPNSCYNKKEYLLNLFDNKCDDNSKMCKGCKTNEISIHNGIKCYVKDWEKNEKVEFYKLF